MIANKLKNWFKSDFVRNSTVLLSGNAIGQAIALLVYPLLSRLYTKEDFGIFALFLSIAGVLNVLATGKYEEAFILTSDRKESSSLLNFTFRILFFFCLILFIILFFFGQKCLSFFKMDTIIKYWYLIPAFILSSGIFTLLTYAGNREKQYKTIASSSLSLSIATSTLKIGFKYLVNGATGLISGQILGQLFACFSFYKLKRIINESLKVNWQDAKTIGNRYQAFPKYTMPRSFINFLSSNMPFLLLASSFGEAKLGLFFLALNVSFRPINMISNSIYQVFYENTARLKEKKKEISKEINTYQKYCLFLAAPLFIIAYALSTFLFKHIFGYAFEESGKYFRYILPWMFMVLLTTPMGFLPLIFKKQEKYMILEIAYFLLRLLGLYVGIYFQNFDLAIILFSGVGVFFMSATYIWYQFLIRGYEKSLSHD